MKVGEDGKDEHETSADDPKVDIEHNSPRIFGDAFWLIIGGGDIIPSEVILEVSFDWPRFGGGGGFDFRLMSIAGLQLQLPHVKPQYKTPI